MRGARDERQRLGGLEDGVEERRARLHRLASFVGEELRERASRGHFLRGVAGRHGGREPLDGRGCTTAHVEPTDRGGRHVLGGGARVLLARDPKALGRRRTTRGITRGREGLERARQCLRLGRAARPHQPGERTGKPQVRAGSDVDGRERAEGLVGVAHRGLEREPLDRDARIAAAELEGAAPTVERVDVDPARGPREDGIRRVRRGGAGRLERRERARAIAEPP